MRTLGGNNTNFRRRGTRALVITTATIRVYIQTITGRRRRRWSCRKTGRRLRADPRRLVKLMKHAMTHYIERVITGSETKLRFTVSVNIS